MNGCSLAIYLLIFESKRLCYCKVASSCLWGRFVYGVFTARDEPQSKSKETNDQVMVSELVTPLPHILISHDL